MTYFLNFFKHKWIVFVEGIKLGGIPLWQLVIHDWSKLTYAERAYSKLLTQGIAVLETQEFKKAQEHHYKRNPHHNRHWVRDGVPTPMPEKYVREMVVDWISADRSFSGGNGDIRAWLSKNYPKMNLHDETKRTLMKVLQEVDIDLLNL